MSFEIIDFHTHPFTCADNNICSHAKYCDMSIENTRRYYESLSIGKICGAVISKPGCADCELPLWEKISKNNAAALELQQIYGDFYIPGFHVHPDFVRESCEEIERMSKKGLKLIGELVPYLDGWSDYSCKGLDEILDTAEQYDMVVSFHSMGDDAMDRMVERHPNVTLVAAHPGEYDDFMRHMERMKKSKNYYLDLSGYGLFRHGMLRHAVDIFGSDRFLFGSDYPTCNPAMYLGGVLLESLLSDSEKEKILSGNAKRLLYI